jgi:hypothetical protein
MMVRNNSRRSLGSLGSKGNKPGSLSDRSDNSGKRIEPRKNMMSAAQNSKFVLNTRTIQRNDDVQKNRELMRENMNNQGDQGIDDKINKLQNLLKMAKGGQ